MRRWLGWLLALLCTGCGTVGEWRPARERGQALYLVDHGLHVGLVVPAGELQRHLPALKDDFPAARLMEVGWGDRAFYQDEQAASFARDAAGNPKAVGAGRYGGGRFYASVESYHLLHTCNTWVARRLVAAGLPLRPAWAFTAGGLMRQAACCVKGEYDEAHSPATD